MEIELNAETQRMLGVTIMFCGMFDPTKAKSQVMKSIVSISNNLWLIYYRYKKNYLLDCNQRLRLGCEV